MIRALVTGAHGQVGSDVVRLLQGRADTIALARADLDLADPEAIRSRLREFRPALIVNAAAFTAVDRAESQPDLARSVNAQAPGIFAEEARRLGALLVHYSTDYVFDGTKQGAYVEDDACAPLNVYGATKLEGEQAIAASGCAHVILRTSWVYAPRGSNFLLTMLRLAATRPELRVVDDQRGAPTSSLDIARATLALFAHPLTAVVQAPHSPIAHENLERTRSRSGLYHATAAGETSWFGFAGAIFEAHAATPGFQAPRLVAIPTSEYPTPARRPLNSVLSCERLQSVFGVSLRPWQEGLADALAELPS